jgi:hypothetical protein
MIDLAAGYAIRIASELVRSYLSKAESFAIEDARHCQNYLLAAQVAIWGLEKEYDQILVQAEVCDLHDPEQVRRLRERILNYLSVDDVRLQLDKAITGLETCRAALQENIDRWFQWPPTRKNRQEVLADFDRLFSELERYLRDLKVQGLEFRPSWTGVGIQPQWEMLENLPPKRPIDESTQERFSDIIERARQDRTKDRLLNFTEGIERSSNKLLQTFR